MSDDVHIDYVINMVAQPFYFWFFQYIIVFGCQLFSFIGIFTKWEWVRMNNLVRMNIEMHADKKSRIFLNFLPKMYLNFNRRKANI